MNLWIITWIVQHHQTNKLKQEGNAPFTEPPCSPYTQPLTYDSHPVLPKNSCTVPTASLGRDPNIAPTTHDCPFHAANHTITYGDHSVHDDDYPAVLTGILWYKPVPVRPGHFCLMPTPAHLQYTNHPYR